VLLLCYLFRALALSINIFLSHLIRLIKLTRLSVIDNLRALLLVIAIKYIGLMRHCNLYVEPFNGLLGN